MEFVQLIKMQQEIDDRFSVKVLNPTKYILNFKNVYSV